MSGLPIVLLLFPTASQTLTPYHVVHTVVAKTPNVISGFALRFSGGNFVLYIGVLIPAIVGLFLFDFGGGGGNAAGVGGLVPV